MTDHPLKGRKQSPEHIAARVAARRRNGTLGGYKIADTSRYSEANRKKWEDGVYEDRPAFHGHTEESKAKIAETQRERWASGAYDDKAPAARRAVSAMERSLAPYLAALGYRHTEEQACFIACEDRTRMPDFVDVERRRVFEFFGNFWHHPDDEAAWIEQYALKGWECTVLWEDELHDWLVEHADLVDEQTHAAALATSRARHRYPTRGNSLVFRA